MRKRVIATPIEMNTVWLRLHVRGLLHYATAKQLVKKRGGLKMVSSTVRPWWSIKLMAERVYGWILFEQDIALIGTFLVQSKIRHNCAFPTFRIRVSRPQDHLTVCALKCPCWCTASYYDCHPPNSLFLFPDWLRHVPLPSLFTWFLHISGDRILSWRHSLHCVLLDSLSNLRQPEWRSMIH